MINTARPATQAETNVRLKREWTDQYVEVSPDRPELRRFAGIIGRVVTVNWNNKAVVDFQDGGWYDISPAALVKVDASQAAAKYDATTNSAQARPERQA